MFFPSLITRRPGDFFPTLRTLPQSKCDGHYKPIFPGFIIPLGSSALLIRRITSTP